MLLITSRPTAGLPTAEDGGRGGREGREGEEGGGEEERRN